jgi:hypothetical protein
MAAVQKNDREHFWSTAAAMPVVRRLPIPAVSKREITPFMPIMMDENSVSNNIQILHNVFRTQAGLAEAEFNDHPLHLVGGDCKTVNRIWSAQRAASGNVSSQYSTSLRCQA